MRSAPARYGWRMRFAALLAGLAFPLAAAATEPTWHLTMQLHSFHEHTTRDNLTNHTPGLGVMRRTETHWLAGAGIFRNSIGRTAGYGYVGKQWPLGRVLAGGIAGVTHHYKFNNGGIVPLGAAVVTVPLNERWSVELIGIPRVRDFTYNTLNISVSWRFR
ncbi:MAG: hypothetical protein C0518_05640 [Opitutus sp.]|nr:hypothetical protein [Opitutus sp.]